MTITNPDYHQFIIEALTESASRYSANNILIHAFLMFDKVTCNDIIQADIDYCTPDTIGEYFHKQFRQIDMTETAALDMVIWHAMHERTNIHKLLGYIAEHAEEFKEKSIKRLVSDYEWDD